MASRRRAARTGDQDGIAAALTITIGQRATIDARVTKAGLLSIGAIVSGILLSTAVLVFVAGRSPARSAQAELPA